MKNLRLLIFFTLFLTLLVAIHVFIFEIVWKEQILLTDLVEGIGLKEISFLKKGIYDPFRFIYLISLPILFFVTLGLYIFYSYEKRVGFKDEASLMMVEGDLSRKKSKLILILLFTATFIASVGFRLYFYKRTNPLHLPCCKDWHDWVLGTRAFLELDFSLYHEVRRPLYPLLSAITSLVTDDPVSGGQYTSLIAGSLVPSVAALSGYLLCGLTGAVFMALILMFEPLLLEYSVQNSGYSLYTLLVALLFHFALLSINKNRVRDAILTGLSSGLILITMIKGLVTVAITIFYITLLNFSNEGGRSRLLNSSITFILMILPVIMLLLSSTLLPIRYATIESLVLSSDQDATSIYGDIPLSERLLKNLEEFSRSTPIPLVPFLIPILFAPLYSGLNILRSKVRFKEETWRIHPFFLDLFAIIFVSSFILHLPFIFTDKYFLPFIFPSLYLFLRGIISFSAVLSFRRRIIFHAIYGIFVSITLIFTLFNSLKQDIALLDTSFIDRKHRIEVEACMDISKWIDMEFGNGAILFSSSVYEILPFLKGGVRYIRIPKMEAKDTLDKISANLDTLKGKEFGRIRPPILLLVDNLTYDRRSIIDDFEERFMRALKGGEVLKKIVVEDVIGEQKKDVVLMLISIDRAINDMRNGDDVINSMK